MRHVGKIMTIRKIETRYGKMHVLDSDSVISKSLIEYGEWSHCEIAVLEHFIKPGMKVLDIGANIGTHTLAFSKMVGPSGFVLSFEPQPFIFSLLAANVIENEATNVLTLNAAVGRASSWINMPNINYSAPNNYGALRMAPFLTDSKDKINHIPIPVHRLDDLSVAASANVIKIDVEEMEAAVLEGARGLISKSRPILLVENEIAGEASEATLKLLFEMEYDAYWQGGTIFNPDNFKGNKNDIFPRQGCLNMLAIPRENSAIKINGKKIASIDEHPRKSN
jgi:FkbM family methyltransferase